LRRRGTLSRRPAGADFGDRGEGALPPDCVTEGIEENDSLTAVISEPCKHEQPCGGPSKSRSGLNLGQAVAIVLQFKGRYSALSFCNSKSDVKSINVGPFSRICALLSEWRAPGYRSVIQVNERCQFQSTSFSDSRWSSPAGETRSCVGQNSFLDSSRVVLLYNVCRSRVQDQVVQRFKEGRSGIQVSFDERL
jgi:hypothetical protein